MGRVHKYKVIVNGKLDRIIELSDDQIKSSGRTPGNLADMINIETIIADQAKNAQPVFTEDVVVEYIGTDLTGHPSPA